MTDAKETTDKERVKRWKMLRAEYGPGSLEDGRRIEVEAMNRLIELEEREAERDTRQCDFFHCTKFACSHGPGYQRCIDHCPVLNVNMRDKPKPAEEREAERKDPIYRAFVPPGGWFDSEPRWLHGYRFVNANDRPVEILIFDNSKPTPAPEPDKPKPEVELLQELASAAAGMNIKMVEDADGLELQLKPCAECARKDAESEAFQVDKEGRIILREEDIQKIVAEVRKRLAEE